MAVLFHSNVAVPVDDEQENRLYRGPGRIRVCDVLDERNIKLIVLSCPVDNPGAVEAVPKAIGRQHQQSRRVEVSDCRRDGGAQVVLGQHIVHGVVYGNDIEPAFQPDCAHISQVV